MAKLTKPIEAYNPDQAKRPIFVASEYFPANTGFWHAHHRIQLIHASDGVLTVKTRLGLWVAPPYRGVWVLSGLEHNVTSRKGFWLRTLYAEPDIIQAPKQCCVVTVNRLLSELLIAASEFGTDYPPEGPEQRLIQVIVDRLSELTTVSAYLPRPLDPRLARISQHLEKQPADSTSLDKLAPKAGLSGRTAARLFAKETGMTFGQWRQQLRLLCAMEFLGTGESVTHAAFEVGYHDVSAFIVAFKKAFGTTPANYFK
ncbi:helix-turn-helix transcriptional regulator [Desulfobulbus rhabdoformis]|uniref:AraC family transcriptional regulator n=1 Tax=Desulfobulbus rhabdoformis TaxID=34032 RepID=UPI001964B4B4|nr:helix-turn-helix transcriptional regulator [Desulfobulbus rhabdoformis]MBM9616888.1 helix-turn-helix transcriptional regulator [Desulfobulbus rhabdoformis]